MKKFEKRSKKNEFELKQVMNFQIYSIKEKNNSNEKQTVKNNNKNNGKSNIIKENNKNKKNKSCCCFCCFILFKSIYNLLFEKSLKYNIIQKNITLIENVESKKTNFSELSDEEKEGFENYNYDLSNVYSNCFEKVLKNPNFKSKADITRENIIDFINHNLEYWCEAFLK